MAIFPVRELGGAGVITDANPYDLPMNAFSKADNVIFDDGRVQRAPVFKGLFEPILSGLSYDEVTGDFNTNPNSYNSAGGGNIYNSRFLGSYASPTSGKTVFVCDKLGAVREYPNGVLADVTPAGTLVNNEEQWTHAQVAGLSFLGRKGMVPYARNITSDQTYNLMSSGLGSTWAATDTCAIVRSYLEYALCLNVTKDGVEYPTMVKWSDPIQYGSATNEINWDPTDTTASAGENVLAELKTPIKDGLALGTQFIIYADDQVWIMEYTGSSFVFNFRRLFPTGGIIATNCVTEVEGKHFVFGKDDIYMHDGNSIKSIADGRVRRKIYEAIDRNKVKSFSVTHDSQENLIYFCYVSKETDVGFPGTYFCNRAAVYNYRNDTWSFMDLPNVVGSAEIEIALSDYLYRDLDRQYDQFNTSYSAFEQTTPKCVSMLGIIDETNGLLESRVYAVDLSTQGVISLPASTEAYRPAVFERVGIDLAEPNGGIRDYKMIRSVVPQAVVLDSGNTFTFEIGSNDLPSTNPVWHTTYNYNPDVDYKVDTKAAGRYLAYRVTVEGLGGFKFSGFDADLQAISRR